VQRRAGTERKHGTTGCPGRTHLRQFPTQPSHLPIYALRELPNVRPSAASRRPELTVPRHVTATPPVDRLGEPAQSGDGLNPRLLNGPDGPRMGANVQRNMEEDDIRFAMGVFERPAPLTQVVEPTADYRVLAALPGAAPSRPRAERHRIPRTRCPTTGVHPSRRERGAPQGRGDPTALPSR
jgi:hypothetical protein